MVVVDAAGCCGADGRSSVRRRADGLGFVEGAAWDEHTVGTNAIGTALVVRKPVQAYSAEHFVRVHHASPPEPAPAFRGRGRLDAADPRAGPTRLTQIRQEGPGRKGDPEVAPWARRAHKLDLAAEPLNPARFTGPCLALSAPPGHRGGDGRPP